MTKFIKITQDNSTVHFIDAFAIRNIDAYKTCGEGHIHIFYKNGDSDSDTAITYNKRQVAEGQFEKTVQMLQDALEFCNNH